MYDRILVPVDGSDCAKRAVGYGALLAATYDATVELLHVVGRSRSGDDDAETAFGKEILEEAADLVGDVPVETRLLEGVPHRTVTEHVAERDVDLVVMGRRGRTGLGEGLLGSVTERVLAGVDVPVVVVPDGDPADVPGGFSTVLLPTDGSENAEAAAAYAADVAGQFGAALHVVTVVDVQSAGGLFSAGGVTPEFVDRLEAAGREAVEGMVSAVRAVDADADPTTAVVHGTPHEGIRDYATENGVDLVVMGSRGRSNLERQLFGSVTQRVLRVVDVPVFVVRNPD